jgi:L,D-transpeptidase ErfK/SrfK
MRRILPLLLLLAADAHADTYPLSPSGDDLVGAPQWAKVQRDDTLIDVARRAGLGYDEVVLANPDVDKWLPPEGARVRLPTQYLLPPGERRGIVINLAEMRLYYYPKDAPARVVTFPVGVGREDWRTPVTETRVTGRVRDPVWYPTESVRREHAADGRPLPEAVPPGPDNPLGPLALTLALPRHLIHGTNHRFGIGMHVTHGCIRLYPEHMQQLFDQVPDGMPVRIIDQAYKSGWSGGRPYLEVHPAAGDGGREWRALAGRFATAAAPRSLLDLEWQAAYRETRQPSGMPTPLSGAAEKQQAAAESPPPS